MCHFLCAAHHVYMCMCMYTVLQRRTWCYWWNVSRDRSSVVAVVGRRLMMTVRNHRDRRNKYITTSATHTHTHTGRMNARHWRSLVLSAILCLMWSIASWFHCSLRSTATPCLCDECLVVGRSAGRRRRCLLRHGKPVRWCCSLMCVTATLHSPSLTGRRMRHHFYGTSCA